MTPALICGITGQDGAYLAAALLADGIRVVGTSRDPATVDRWRLAALGIADQVELVALSPGDRAGAARLVAESGVGEIYALWGQSSVSASFERPAETVDGIVTGTLDLLEAVRGAGRSVRLFHAASSESFGDLSGAPAGEETALRPQSPYGAAKAAAQMLVRSYRASFGTWAVNGILFNHDSPLRPRHFVTRKIAIAVAHIAAGSGERLRLGNIAIARDWGWAPEYVEAMRRSLRGDEPFDVILATGRTCPLEAFVAAAFASVGLNWRDHVDSDPALIRPTDPAWIGARVEWAAERLDWRATTSMEEVAQRMVAAEQVRREGGVRG